MKWSPLPFYSILNICLCKCGNRDRWVEAPMNVAPRRSWAWFSNVNRTISEAKLSLLQWLPQLCWSRRYTFTTWLRFLSHRPRTNYQATLECTWTGMHMSRDTVTHISRMDMSTLTISSVKQVGSRHLTFSPVRFTNLDNLANHVLSSILAYAKNPCGALWYIMIRTSLMFRWNINRSARCSSHIQVHLAGQPQPQRHRDGL